MNEKTRKKKETKNKIEGNFCLASNYYYVY